MTTIMKNQKVPLPVTKVTWTYAVTVKWIRKKDATQEHYQEWLKNALLKQFRVTAFWYEYDSCNRLHLHGIAEAAPNYFKKRLDYPGFHRHITRLVDKRDVADWTKYCKKDQPSGALLDVEDVDKVLNELDEFCYTDQEIAEMERAAVEEYELFKLKVE